MRATRALLYSLPALTLGVVGYAVLFVGASQPYPGALVFGGPTRGTSALSFRITAVTRFGEDEKPLPGLPLTMTVDGAPGGPHSWTGETDAHGDAQARFAMSAPASGPLSVVVRDERGRTLALGTIDRSVEQWTASARRSGGALHGQRDGALKIDVAPGRGAFAVPFVDPLWIQVRDAGDRPVAGARVTLEPDGLQRVGDTPLISDDQGRALANVRPLEHVVTLGVRAELDERRGKWFGSVPIAVGALHARRDGNRIVIESPVIHERAHYALVSATARISGGSVALTPDGRGGAVGEIVPTPDESAATWCVISSERDLASPSAVGWPLASPVEAPLSTFTAADQLLLDGRQLGFARDAQRRARARLLAGGFALGAALLAGLLLTLEARDAERRLGRHLVEAGVADGDPANSLTRDDARRMDAGHRRPWVVAIAIVCVALGFVMIALVALQRTV